MRIYVMTGAHVRGDCKSMQRCSPLGMSSQSLIQLASQNSRDSRPCQLTYFNAAETTLRYSLLKQRLMILVICEALSLFGIVCWKVFNV